MFVVEKREGERVAIFRLTGGIDLMRMMALRDTIKQVVGEGCLQVILDCRRLRSINEKSLEILTDTVCRLRRLDGDVLLLALPPAVEDTFRAAGVYAFFEHFPGERQARRACRLKRLAMAG
ncbi:MAG: STAS domain-containing protein [Candidatus Methylomirabilales bacterium]